MKSLYIFITALVLLSACTDDFEFEFDNADKRIVIEANLDNLDRVQTLRVTKLMTSLGEVQYSNFNNEGIPVLGAEIKLTNETGEEWVFTEKPAEYEGDEFLGYYQNTEFRADIGHLYTLSIKIDGEEYKASASVNDVPEIKKLIIRKRQSEVPGKSDQYVPYISFDNAPTEDYYRFEVYNLNNQENNHNLIRQTSNRRWGFSVLADRFLPSQVNELMIDDGQSPDGADFYPGYPGQVVRVYFGSLSKEAFLFYEALIDQFSNDGGVLNPTPASPPTNFNNGGIGFFSLSYIRYADVEIEE
jgi:hypothetical protein